MQLKKVCNHPYLFPDVEPEGAEVPQRVRLPHPLLCLLHSTESDARAATGLVPRQSGRDVGLGVQSEMGTQLRLHVGV